jgi:hypothetical protein
MDHFMQQRVVVGQQMLGTMRHVQDDQRCAPVAAMRDTHAPAMRLVVVSCRCSPSLTHRRLVPLLAGRDTRTAISSGPPVRRHGWPNLHSRAAGSNTAIPGHGNVRHSVGIYNLAPGQHADRRQSESTY